jgi:hypothetical protein
MDVERDVIQLEPTGIRRNQSFIFYLGFLAHDAHCQESCFRSNPDPSAIVVLWGRGCETGAVCLAKSRACLSDTCADNTLWKKVAMTKDCASEPGSKMGGLSVATEALQ